jgi:small ubiquitin-related modifier
MDAYCARQAISPNTVRFLFDGERLQESATPKDLEMEDGDEIDAMVE